MGIGRERLHCVLLLLLSLSLGLLLRTFSTLSPPSSRYIMGDRSKDVGRYRSLVQLSIVSEKLTLP